jgi:hypothetical protein
MVFDVEPADGGERFEVRADSRDVVVWEKTSRTNERYVELLSEMRMTALYRLCHIAGRRQSIVDCKLPEFEQEFILHFAHEETVIPTPGGVSSDG